MENNNSPAYYAVIPAAVRYDTELPANAKLLYGEITAMATAEGYCWAKNSYFAELYGKTEKTISVWIGLLEKRGYLRREIIRDERGEVVQRRLYIAAAPSPEKSGEGMEENRDTSPEKSENPPPKNVKENNTSINNTREREMPAPLRSREKKPYGEMQNVLLSDREFHSLLVRYSREQVEAEIESLSLYMASKGKRFSSHYATLLTWLRKDTQQNVGASSPVTVVDMEEY